VAYRSLAILAALAAGLSLYMTVTSLLGTQQLGCGEGTFNCESLLATRWSNWLSLPVTTLGFAAYATLAGLAAGQLFELPDRVRKLSRGMLLGGTAVVAAAAFWFIALQAVVLKEYCLYCTAIHACGLAMLLVAVSATEASLREIAVSLGVGLAGGAILVAGQVTSLNQPPQKPPYHVVAAPDLRLPEPIEIPPTGDSSGTVSVLNGQIVIGRDSRPMLGDPTASRVTVKMFDYTCGYCRRLHGQLEELIAESPDEYAVVLIHVPLSPECNPHRKEDAGRHADACELTRLALAVWLTDREAFAEFNRWLCGGESARTAAAARAEAERLIGTEPLADALAEPRIDSMIAENVELYALDQITLLPSLLTERRLISGSFLDAEQLREVWSSPGRSLSEDF